MHANCITLSLTQNGMSIVEDVYYEKFHFTGSPLPLPRAFFGEGVGMVWLDDLECTGMEMSLLECEHNGVGQSNCRHSEDVSIICPCKCNYF